MDDELKQDIAAFMFKWAILTLGILFLIFADVL